MDEARREQVDINAIKAELSKIQDKDVANAIQSVGRLSLARCFAPMSPAACRIIRRWRAGFRCLRGSLPTLFEKVV